MNENLLIDCLDKLEITYSGKQANLLILYINQILKWNKRTNLVKADKRELIIDHIVDSLAGLKTIKKCMTNFNKPVLIADIGSGAGLPGIPVSIFLPEAEVSLIERSAKKIIFLNNINILINTGNLKIIESDIKNVKKSFHIILFRAFTPLGRYNFSNILEDNGYIIAYKGQKNKIINELNNVDKSYKSKIVPLKIPHSNKTRHLVILNK